MIKEHLSNTSGKFAAYMNPASKKWILDIKPKTFLREVFHLKILLETNFLNYYNQCQSIKKQDDWLMLADEHGSAYIMYLQLTGLGLAWLKIGSEQFAALVAF